MLGPRGLAVACIALYAVYAAGCTAHSARVDRRSRDSVSGVEKTLGVRSRNSLVAELREQKHSLGLVDFEGFTLGKWASERSQATSTEEQILDRIASSVSRWGEYRERMVAGYERTENSRVVSSVAPVAQQAATDGLLAVRQSHAVELLNAQMRVGLLEARKAKSDGVYGQLLDEKLARAKADMDALEMACKAEIERRTQSEPENASVTEGTEAEANTVETVELAESNRAAPQGPDIVWSAGKTLVTSRDERPALRPVAYPPGYKGKLLNTCESIDRVVARIGEEDQ